MDETAGEVRALLRAALEEATATWSVGSFGAVAEFRRGAGEAASDLEGGRLGCVTARGGIALTPPRGLVPVAYETPLDGGWSHAVALCMPASARAAPRRVVTELGPDADALRAEDRAALLFDLGLGLPQAQGCLRATDPETVARLRAACGLPPFDPGSPVLGLLAGRRADAVFVSPAGRIEVFSGGTGLGPRACVAPAILRLGRTHAATAPIPRGLAPCAHLHPSHPCRDAEGRAIPFRRDRHDAFQAVYARWGDPGRVALKAQVLSGCAAGLRDRHARAVAKVARLQEDASQAEQIGTGQVPEGHTPLNDAS